MLRLMNGSVALFFILVAIALFSGCNTGERSSSGGASPDTKPAGASEFIGVLRGGYMAIGAETTGWRLEEEDAAKPREVDVRRCLAQAEQLKGTVVRIRGRVETRAYVERGPTPVLVATLIERYVGK